MYALKKPGTPIQANWTIGCRKWVPKQMNASDCGVFVCQFAKYLAQRWVMDFTQENMPQFRQLMIEEIQSKKLIVSSPV
jgi:sentrin-specific protease 1